MKFTKQNQSRRGTKAAERRPLVAILSIAGSVGIKLILMTFLYSPFSNYVKLFTVNPLNLVIKICVHCDLYVPLVTVKRDF